MGVVFISFEIANRSELNRIGMIVTRAESDHSNIEKSALAFRGFTVPACPIY